MIPPSPEQWLILVPIGFAAGAAGTFVGLGGGFIFVPLLLLVFKMEPSAVAATSLFAIMCNSVVGSILHGRARRIDWKMGFIAGLGAIPAAIAGTLLVGLVDRAAFRTIIGVILLFAAVMLIFRKNIKCGEGKPLKIFRPGSISHWKVLRNGTRYGYSFNPVVLAVFSVFKGLFAGFSGIAGGSILVPFLILAMRVPVVISAATTQFTIIFTSSAATASNIARGTIKFEYAIPLSVGVVGGAILGARLAGRVRPDVVRWALAVVVAVVSIRMLLWQ